jgi:hypothetical protein
VTETFARIAEVTFASRGYPNQPLVVLPRDVEFMTQAQLRQFAEEIASAVADRLVVHAPQAAKAAPKVRA